MLESVAYRIVNTQIRKGLLKEEDRNIYQYGYQMLMEYCINIATSITIAAFFHAYKIVLVFSLAYFLLRGYAGGYHAKTSIGCLLMSATVLGAVVAVVRYVGNISFSKELILAEVVMLPYVFKKMPIPVKNKPISENEKIHFGKMARWVYAVELAVGIVLIGLGRMEIALSVLAAHGVVFIMAVGDSAYRFVKGVINKT
ncbi:MAG: accessory gene regulator B family protein [Lachnospiraceae bacterium]|nr:accessory gene regulator B family protein [Lachnospiraceae bacterium]